MKTSPYQISAFTEAARARSFSNAARIMGVTQSSVTQHVAKLERQMGTLLFLRRRDGLELTQAGRELFEITDRLRTLEQLVHERVEDFSDLSGGYLSIVANAPRPALPIISRYMAQYPKVEVEFTLVSWDRGMAQLRDRDVDIALLVEPEPLPGLDIWDIGETRYRAYVHRDHRLARCSSVSLANLEDEVVIVPEDGSLTQKLIKGRAAELGITFRSLIKTSTFPMVKEAVLHEVGVGFMLQDGQFPSENLVELPIKELAQGFRNCLVTPQEKKGLRIVKSFYDTAADCLVQV